MRLEQLHRVTVPNRYGEIKGRIICMENARGKATEDLDRVRWAKIYFDDQCVASLPINSVYLDIDYYKNLYGKYLLLKALKSHLRTAIQWYK